MKRIKRIKRALGVGFLIVLGLYSSSVYAKPFPPGSVLPSFNMEVADSADLQAYLGIKDAKTISLSQIPAKLVIVEFFSVFCPVCQGNAPFLNRLYQVVTGDQALAKDVKIIGVALIGTGEEVALFKERFGVKFPLFFDDPRKTIEGRVNLRVVPLTLVIDKNGKVVMSHDGALKDKDFDAFLIELRKNHGAL